MNALILAVILAANPIHGEAETPVAEGLRALPIREITVFKDGHAFLLHAGRLPVAHDGNIQLDYLPTPVMGTFWPYSANRSLKLKSVTGSSRIGLAERKALTIAELIEANPGASATILTADNRKLAGEIVDTPRLPL